MEILRAGSIQCDSDLEGPSASIVVEKRLWSCSVCASVVGLHFFAFFCIYLHLFAFFCIAFFVISICIFFPPLAKEQSRLQWMSGPRRTAVSQPLEASTRR